MSRGNEKSQNKLCLYVGNVTFDPASETFIHVFAGFLHKICTQGVKTNKNKNKVHERNFNTFKKCY